MSKIKLNAASGGGSVSLEAPTSTTSNANVVFKLPVADGTSGQALTTNASGQLAFATVSSAIQTTSGTDNFTIADGNLVIGTSGHGIDFSANSNSGGMTSELLDDYEEGTFGLTVVTGGFSSISGTGKYTRIGRVCAFVIDAGLSGSGNSDVLELSGLPFNASEWASVSGYAQYYNDEGTKEYTPVIRSSANSLRIQQFGAEAGGQAFNAGYINFNGIYHVT